MVHSIRALMENTEAPNGLTNSVGQIADRLMRSIRDNGNGMDLAQRTLLERALAVAAEAEQRLAEQTRRIAVLEMLTLTDEITGLLNRRGFNRELRRILADARRYDERGILCFIDLDDFKTINDVFGHMAGDRVLHTIGRLLQIQVRENDVVARLGGDEFALVLAKCDQEDGMRRAIEIERVLNYHAVNHGKNTIPVCGSVGIVTYDSTDEVDDLIRRADQAMYAKKRVRTVKHGDLGENVLICRPGSGGGD